MKAIVQDSYGSPDVLELRDIDKPVVEDDEVLVRVRAASVHPDVWHVLTGLPYVLPHDGGRAAQTKVACSRNRSGRDHRVGGQERDAVSSR